MIYREHFDAVHRVLQNAISLPDLLTLVAFENKALQLSFLSPCPVPGSITLCCVLCQPKLLCWDCTISVFLDSRGGIDSLGPSERQRDSFVPFLDGTTKCSIDFIFHTDQFLSFNHFNSGRSLEGERITGLIEKSSRCSLTLFQKYFRIIPALSNMAAWQMI